MTGSGRLVTFQSDNTQTVTTRAITGLRRGERVVGLDRRPLTGQLLALGSASRLYVLDRATGRATPAGPVPFTPALSGSAFGFDVNPVADAVRVVSDRGQDLRLEPGQGRLAGQDGQLAYAAGDAGAGSTPNVSATAYTNAVRGATTTQLFGVDTARDTLVRQDPPNAGTLRTVGPL